MSKDECNDIWKRSKLKGGDKLNKSYIVPELQNKRISTFDIIKHNPGLITHFIDEPR